MRAVRAISAVLALVVANAGCVRCIAPKCHAIVRDVGPECEVPCSSRERVHTFLISGVNPLGCGYASVEGCLNRHGFRKIGRAGCYHGGWLLGEMARIRTADPEARFVLVGADLGAFTALSTASRALEQNLPVDAVVMLDPIGPRTMTGPNQVRTILIRSNLRTVLVPNAEMIAVSGATPFDLGDQTTTLATVAGVMEEVAMGIWAETPDRERFKLWDHGKLPSGPMSAKSDPELPGDWNFLNERVGSMTTPLPDHFVEFSEMR